MKIYKTKIKFYHIFFFAFFSLYFIALYYFLYHTNNLSPFQYNIHFFSNIIGSLFKRFLTEAAPYMLLFYLIFYTKRLWLRIILATIFLSIFILNSFVITFYSYTHTNFHFYIIEHFHWHLFFSFLNTKLLILFILLVLSLAIFTIVLIKLKNDEEIWPLKKRLFIGLFFILVIGSPFLTIHYDTNMTIMEVDSQQKKFISTVELETAGMTLLVRELKQAFFPPENKKFELTTKEQEIIEQKKLDLQITQNFVSPPKKIILIVAESLNQDFISYYNSQIPEVTPYIDSLLQKYPHIDNFYPSGPYTLHGVSSSVCGHTNLKNTSKNPAFFCTPKLLQEKGFSTEFIRGAKKYYLGENITFQKFGFQKITAKEELNEKYPDFKNKRSDLYSTWGFSDNYIFNEAVERLKNSRTEEKMFLTLLLVDTHTPGGRCFREKQKDDPKDPILFSVHCLDNALQNFMDKLEAEKLFTDDLLIIFTSDQLYPGYTKIPGDNFQTSFILQPARIPFLLITKQSLTLQARQGSQIDIATTILDLLNIDIPPYYMGKSLISNPNTIPIGQDRNNGYMITDNHFYHLPISESNLSMPKQKTGPKGFQVNTDFGTEEELIAIVEQKLKEYDEKEQVKNQDELLHKWYYNKFFMHSE